MCFAILGIAPCKATELTTNDISKAWRQKINNIRDCTGLAYQGPDVNLDDLRKAKEALTAWCDSKGTNDSMFKYTIPPECLIFLGEPLYNEFIGALDSLRLDGKITLEQFTHNIREISSRKNEIERRY